MLMPSVLSFVLLIVILRFSRRLWIVAAVCMLSSLLFSLLLINNYYRFYPTFGQIFNKNNAPSLTSSGKEILLQSTPASNNQNNHSLENSLVSIASELTAGKVYSFKIPGTV